MEFEQAARYDPQSTSIHKHLAYNYYMEGLENKSVEELQKSLELNPEDVETRQQMADFWRLRANIRKPNTSSSTNPEESGEYQGPLRTGRGAGQPEQI